MDGISVTSNGNWLTGDFLKGELILVDKHSRTQTLPEGLTTPADFFYLPQQQLVIPSFARNQVTAYQYTEAQEIEAHRC